MPTKEQLRFWGRFVIPTNAEKIKRIQAMADRPQDEGSELIDGSFLVRPIPLFRKRDASFPRGELNLWGEAISHSDRQ